MVGRVAVGLDLVVRVGRVGAGDEAVGLVTAGDGAGHLVGADLGALERHLAVMVVVAEAEAGLARLVEQRLLELGHGAVGVGVDAVLGHLGLQRRPDLGQSFDDFGAGQGRVGDHLVDRGGQRGRLLGEHDSDDGIADQKQRLFHEELSLLLARQAICQSRANLTHLSNIVKGLGAVIIKAAARAPWARAAAFTSLFLCLLSSLAVEVLVVPFCHGLAFMDRTILVMWW